MSAGAGVAVFLSEGIGYLGWAGANSTIEKPEWRNSMRAFQMHAEQGNRYLFRFFKGFLLRLKDRRGGRGGLLTELIRR